MPDTIPQRRPILIIRDRPRQSLNNTPHSNQKGPRLLTALFSVLALLALVHFLIVMRTGGAPATQSPTTCTSLIRNTDYTKYVQFQPSSQQMGAIQYIDQLMGGQPAALVQVISTDTQHTLDVYVYGCAMQQHTPTLTLLFKQQGLVQGMVNVSKANTLLIGSRDVTLSQQATAVVQPMQQSIYQEYHWQNGTFVQTLFPGLYPVTSRSEAEALQDQVNNGASIPWTDPQATAEQMAKDILQWSTSDPQDKVLDNDGATAHVLLVQKSPHVEVTVTLKRLIQQNNTGLWFITGAQTQGITLDSSSLTVPVTSPISVRGTVTTTDGGATATLFDHTLSSMASLNSATLNVKADGSYAGNIIYTNNKQNQQGLLLIKNVPLSGSSEPAQLMLAGIVIG